MGRAASSLMVLWGLAQAGMKRGRHSTKSTFSNGVAGLKRKSRREFNSTTVMADDVM